MDLTDVQNTAEGVSARDMARLGFTKIGIDHARFPKHFPEGAVSPVPEVPHPEVWFHEGSRLRLVHRTGQGLVLSGFDPGGTVLHWEITFTKNAPLLAVITTLTQAIVAQGLPRPAREIKACRNGVS